MTDKEKVRKEIQRLQNLTMDENKNFYSETAEGEYNALCNIEHFIDSLQEEPEPQFKVGDIIRSKVWELAVHEIVSMDDSAYYFENGGMIRFTDQELWELAEEPVSEVLNTESMIESYKQRLISQANGVKNSPLIDMCLASYKHGINETLNALNLSNAERIGKEWKEGLVSEDLEKAANKYIKGNYSPWLYKAMFDCFKAGAEWGKNQAKVEIQAQSMALAHGCPKKQVSEDSKKELPKVWDRETLDDFAYQVAYDLSNDWMKETATWDDVETAVKLGVKWQKEKDQKK